MTGERQLRRLRALVVRLSSLLRPSARDGETAEELESHIQLHADDYVRAGLDAAEARRLAIIKLGGVAQTREECRRRRGVPLIEDLWRDLSYGARSLAKNPGFTLVAVLTLALGVGATTAIFSVVNAVLLRPLPYPQADRLAFVGQLYPSGGGVVGTGEPKFIFWREQARSFEALACYSGYGGAGGNLAGGNEAEYVRGLRVSEDFFRALGVYPALGRAFTREENQPGGPDVAILSDAVWQKSFGGDRSVIGKSVTLNGKPVTVVGVMPPGFRFGSDAGLFVPMRARQGANVDPNAEVVGRLKDGVTLEEARAEMKLIAEKYRAAFPRQMQDGESAGAMPYRDLFTEDIAKYLWIILGAVSFLLLIACANVANLQLTRAAARRREIAVRMALGAGGGRVARQLLTEGLVLALAGGAAGLLLALWGTRLLSALVPRGMLPSFAEIGVDWRVLLFALAASVVTGLLFGSAPAWQARKTDVNSALKDSHSATARGRLRGALVVAEVALSLVLLVGAGLLIRTFTNLLAVAPGFDPHNVLTFQINPRGERYDTAEKTVAFYREALERIGRLPGVESAAVTNKLPLDWQFNMPVFLASQPDKAQSVQLRIVSPDYFRALRIGVGQGRPFNDDDDGSAPQVAVVNAAFVRRFFGGQDAFEQRLTVGRGLDEQPRQVVGVVADIKQQGLDRPEPPMLYVPVAQASDKLMRNVRAFTPTDFVVRTSGDPAGLGQTVRREIAAIDPAMPLARVATMEEIGARSVASQRFNMMLVGLFAALGLLLAAVGIYGVISYSVAQGTRDIGIRMALGARPGAVLRLVAGRGMALALAGVCLGVAASLALTRLMSSLLFGVSANDPATFAQYSLILAAVALVACLIPARRATKVDPLIALRYE